MRPDVKAVYSTAPKKIKDNMLLIREYILEVAEECIADVGAIEETIKWGVPGYLPKIKNTGTTVRLQWNEETEEYGLYFHCQSQVIKRIKKKYSDRLQYEDNRGVIFPFKKKPPKSIIKSCVKIAFTYYL